jgi:2'-5' RNA ligase
LRIFVAVCPNAAIKNEIADLQEKFKDLSPQIRLIPPENLHLTIAPPWYENEKGIEKIKEKLKTVCGKVKPFRLAFDRAAYGPTRHAPRLIWASGAPVKELSTLKKEIEKALSLSSEKREFLPHLTLARFRPEHFASFTKKEIDLPVSWEWAIENFCLMQSQLHPRGAVYTVLRSFPL